MNVSDFIDLFLFQVYIDYYHLQYFQGFSIQIKCWNKYSYIILLLKHSPNILYDAAQRFEVEFIELLNQFV